VTATGLLAAISANGIATGAARSLREGFFMFWETLWPLILGFGLSGAVQAFVSRDQMQRAMGDRSPGAIGRATGFGMVSSSCSYAATAMSKSLFQKGADFTTAMVFMFASTNLVLELGIVLFVLMGWQFAAAELVGGPIMILLLAVVGGYAFRPKLVEEARARLLHGGSAAHDHQAMVGVSDERQAELEAEPWKQKLTSKAAWSDAASYTMADLTMLRKELVIGYAVAGLLAVAVPMRAWNALFIPGHGFWTIAENVVLGPVIAFISFVCSVGNVPMAAALWHGGISFGGVISFIFADLITLPLFVIYRKFYGKKLALRVLLTFWAVMSVAGAIVEGLFAVAGLLPKTRPHDIVHAGFEFNYTTVLNVIFLGLFAGLYWLHRNRERFGGGQGYAIDPVCGMQVETASAPARTEYNGRTIYFCADRCRERFEADPERFARRARAGSSQNHDRHQEHHETHESEETTMAIDPVCGMTVDPATAAAVRRHQDRNYFFCNPGCAEAFEADPEKYLSATATPEQEHHRG